ncbi:MULTISPECIES: hypothetical protein [unclassified Bradyrhizobium]|uniref:hypothetical protein n=1 Tax=unclassified Bradyrhizobium TaxID=2631580 RepID=UPI00070B221B|nr:MULTISPECIES: hypothetical protein [unclassified Bradyrhizobium]KQT21733.1 hypothetical protein ASG57_26785 [Bradyrhizobium sp. Leaf396]
MAKDEARRFADQIDGLDALPEDPRTTQDREKLERWQAFAMAPWSRPANLSEAVPQAEAKRVLWLIDAIDMMAFGPDAPPGDALEAGARRLQACRALCRAAAEQSFPLFGMLGETADRLETIPGAYLTVDYRIGSGHNVLERDGSSVPESDDAQFDRLHKAKWFEVQIGDKRQFLAWLSGEAEPIVPNAGPVVTSGRAAVYRAIQEAFRTKFPNGLPAGTSSQDRDDEINKAVRAILRRDVSTRTIQRALKEM